jgi:hypothetical protein
VGPKPKYPYKNEKFGHTGTRKMPHEDESRDELGISVNQKMTKIASKVPETRRKAWNRSSLAALRRNQPYWCLDLGLAACRPVSQSACVV